jgi:O-antigen ligase
MNLEFYNQSQNNHLKLLFLSLLILPFHTLTGIIILLFVCYQIWRSNYQQIIKHILSKALLLSSVLLIISSILAYNPGEAWLGIPHFLPFFLVFLALRTLITDYQDLYFIIYPIIFNSLLVIFFGVAELHFGWISSDFLYQILGWQLTGGGDPVGRLASVFPYANLAALYFVIVIIFAIALLIERTRKQTLQKLDWFLIITIILNIIALGLTNSRNGWIICFLSLVVFALYLGWNWIVQAFAIVGLIVSGASFGNFLGQNLLRRIVPDFLWLRFSDEAYPDRPVAIQRVTQWNFCWDLIGDRPFWGWGLRNFSILYEQKMATYLGHPHNIFLMLGAETGLLNLLVLSLIIGWILARGCLAFISLKKNNYPRIIFFSFLIVMGAYFLYNLADINLFDLRLNTIAWLILASISGISEKVLKQEKFNH